MQLTHAEIEQALVDGVRAKVAAGWEIAAVESDDEDELVFTLTRGIAVERHVAHFDYQDESASSVRIDKGGTAERGRFAPSPFLVAAIKGKGGIEIDNDCGRLYARPYMIDANAKGPAARKLVAETLKSSTDLEKAELVGDEAVFGVELDGKLSELHVTLDDDAKVVRAELRRYEYNPDMTTHKQQAKMKRRIGASVQMIEGGIMGPVLVSGTKRFEIDTSTFESNDTSEHLTCGC
jgi:hypothetical protein